MTAGYAPLPNPRFEPDAERELEDAFDDDEHSEHAPLTRHIGPTESHFVPATPGSYDFEREYDYDLPPPGSPPVPTALAMPNDFGNTNGSIPLSPARPEPPRPSFFRRAVGVLLPQHYARIPTEPTSMRTRGGGVENDGVFANVMAKPARSVAVTNENGESLNDPDGYNILSDDCGYYTYSEAQADAAPAYWEMTVHAPSVLAAAGEMIVDDLPTGSLIFFVSTAFISYFFQFVGFVLTYLLHTTHAAKYGSRTGLGLTMIQYGFYSRTAQDEGEGGVGQELIYWNATTGLPVVVKQGDAGPALFSNETYMDMSPSEMGATSRDWMSILLILLGWFLVLSSIVNFYRVKRWEKSIRDAAEPPPQTPAEQTQHDADIRRNIERVFGIFDYNPEDGHENRRVEETPVPLSEAEERLRRDLRAAGLM
ncbi:uncharacterized protein FIBRA_06426 [Fibroporia radiculosa]|uniref:Metal homeostatis protein BSD2 n=1 Tax=Fibroporia radiculosa TaxID=599839 RepID=J4H426_9APHY|nr:uncharacterized protein FIBRA_06426 [Fibroporia radiculosa]CCM04259.1 predicted protein [Fibroporia radiculosa]